MMRDAEKNQGFTLVEVLVGMLMLTIVIVSVLTAFTASAKNNVHTKKEQSAENLAVNLMEYAKAGGDAFADVFGGTEEAPGVTGMVTLSDVPEGFYTYDVTVEKKYDAAEYEKDLLNAYETIRLGTTDKQTVFVNLGMNGANYDNSAVQMFHGMHSYYVEQLNEEAEEDPDTDPDAEPMIPLTEEQIRGNIARELVLTAQGTTPQKMQLVAQLVYEIDESVGLPDGTERVAAFEVCKSVEFDRGGISFSGTKKLEQIYVLYVPFSGGISGVDIRILDPAKILDSRMFLIWQETVSESLIDNELLEKTMQTRTGGAEVVLSYTTDAGLPADPYHLELYSSVGLDGASSANVESHEYSLVPTESGRRIASVFVKIADPDSGKVLVELSSAYTE